MRLIYRTRRPLLAALLACALPCAGRAQESKRSDAKPEARKDSKPEPRKDAKPEPQKSAKQGARKKSDEGAARRREVLEAVAALKETAETARSFDDVYESVRTQSEAADALWPYDEPTARAILNRAWETANAPGAEDHVHGFGTSEDPHEDALNALTNGRGFIVKTALKHDSRMGDAFMREFEHGIAERAVAAAAAATPQSKAPIVVQQDESPDPASTQWHERRLSPAGWQRIFIARQLIEDGDFKHAAEAAAPLVNEGATLPLLKFILYLRARDARAADALYLHLLEATRFDASADANDVLLLSTPFVSPGLCVSVNSDGSANFITLNYENDEARRAASSLPGEARLAFFNTAASVLLRPRAPREGKAPGDNDDSAALYFAVGRLLPFFDHEAAQLAPALHARQESLAAEIEASRRAALAAKMDVNSLTPKNPSDPLAFPLEMVAQAHEAKERDFARLVVVDEAARLSLWDRARISTEEIEDGEARRAARLIVAMRQVARTASSFDDDDPDAFERAVAFVGAADVPTEVRAYGLAQVAELAARRGRRERADELMVQASAYASEVVGNKQRATALALVTLSASLAGGGRVWELLPAFVRVADETDELQFGGMLLEFSVGMPDRKLWITIPERSISLEEVFAATTRLDAVRTLTEARSFKDEELRAAALLAAARATLEKSARGRAEVLRRGAK
ncbi:MAG: hypothetical protein QOC61_330 [Acidobacteriota bacterium]|nr:hypothetical protein [Acidobacteriota bacterium]